MSARYGPFANRPVGTLCWPTLNLAPDARSVLACYRYGTWTALCPARLVLGVGAALVDGPLSRQVRSWCRGGPCGRLPGRRSETWSTKKRQDCHRTNPLGKTVIGTPKLSPNQPVGLQCHPDRQNNHPDRQNCHRGNPLAYNVIPTGKTVIPTGKTVIPNAKLSS